MVSVYNSIALPLQIVHRALDTLASAVEDMGVNHRGFHILVAEKFPNNPDVVTALQKLRDKGMAEGVTSGPPPEAGFSHGAIGRLLDGGFVNVMSLSTAIPEPIQRWSRSSIFPPSLFERAYLPTGNPA